MKPLLFISHILLFQSMFAQLTAVDVADLTVKVGGVSREVLYYGFAKGDQIIFNFEEVNGKPLKEIEIMEMPGNSKFADFKSTEIKNKVIQVHKTGVYGFGFRNSAMSGRICKIKIQRIPKSEELISFNTDWEWKTLYDTSYVPYIEDSLVGYDTLHYKETLKELVETKIIEDLRIDKNQRVHSYWNSNSSYTYLKVDLPVPASTRYRKERIIGWAYWIGVGSESTRAYAQNVQAIGKITKSVSAAILTPLGALAVGAVTELLTPKTGDDVKYAFMSSYENVQAFLAQKPYYQFDQGKGIAAYGKNNKLLKGSFYIGLHNDNDTRGIDVNVKVVALKEVKIYDDITHDRQKITPTYTTLNKQRMVVKTSKARVNAN